MADEAGLKRTEAAGPIIESAPLIGFGWIGVEVQKPGEARQDIAHLSGDYEAYEYRGPYKTIGKACKKLSSDRPGAKRFYNLYIDDPEKVKSEDCRTKILFR